jgi:hypothetical protein
MKEVIFALVFVAVICVGGYLGLKRIEQRGREAGEAAVAAQVRQQAANATHEANERYVRTLQALELEQKARREEVLSYEEELMRLRDESGKLQDGDIVVFDERWAGWLRGEQLGPADAGRSGVAGH